jgi:hypothetical protein
MPEPASDEHTKGYPQAVGRLSGVERSKPALHLELHRVQNGA